jgi:hypothetical protein
MIFDINNAKGLFFLINRTIKRFCDEEEKDAAKLLFLIMALNHLREWIAPGYKPDRNGNWPPANTAEKRFSQDIYDNCYEFGTIRELCNKSKHLKQIPELIHTEYDTLFDDWSDIDSVPDFDKGPATNYFVDGENVINLIYTVIDFYNTEWFERSEGD